MRKLFPRTFLTKKGRKDKSNIKFPGCIRTRKGEDADSSRRAFLQSPQARLALLKAPTSCFFKIII